MGGVVGFIILVAGIWGCLVFTQRWKEAQVRGEEVRSPERPVRRAVADGSACISFQRLYLLRPAETMNSHSFSKNGELYDRLSHEAVTLPVSAIARAEEGAGEGAENRD